MKKILLTIAIVILGFVANAQSGLDAYTVDWGGNGVREISDPLALTLPGTNIGDIGNVNAPLGSGLLLLAALGAGYAAFRKRK